MATKTITIDTDEWAYPDSTGVLHTVTNGQTFTMELTDTSTTEVTYSIDDNCKVTTTDGLTIYFRPLVDDGSNVKLVFGPFADTQDAVQVFNPPGLLVCSCPKTGKIQYWKPSYMTINDIDTPTTISAKFEDQFGNSFTWTSVTIS